MNWQKNRPPTPKPVKTGPKPRKALRPRSEKKAAWVAKYAAALEAAKVKQQQQRGTTFCERCNRDGGVDGHHPAGQNGARIMVFRLLCRACHDWAHFKDPMQARAEGWLK